MCKAIRIIYETEDNQQMKMLLGNSIQMTLPENNDFYVSFVKCANTVIPRSKFDPHSKPYWTKGVKEAYAQAGETRNLWVREGRPRGMHHQSYCNYKRAKRRFGKRLSLAFEQYIKNSYSRLRQTSFLETYKQT